MPREFGSTWSRWDLHVHTPASGDFASCYHATGDKWALFLDGIEALPKEIEVLGINDYIFLDGYKRVLAERKAGRLKNIKLVLPVIELRLDKFSGVDEKWTRVNYHIIFSEEFAPEFIEQQFLSALSSKYLLSADYDQLRTTGQWQMLITRDSVERLGQLIIDATPAEKRGQLTHPLRVGFNNLCVPLEQVRDALDKPHFKHKHLTAVGKVEWENMSWKLNNIAEKKSVISGVDFVFTCGASIEAVQQSLRSLRDNSVNHRLLDCSDAHHFPDSAEPNRLGKCFTWVKGEPCFEGLRQAGLEYEARIQLSADAPLHPVNTINGIKINVPDQARIENDPFCFRPGTEFGFSPFYTCIIGGRGTGKSMLLQLLNEKLTPGGSDFFRDLPVTIPGDQPLRDLVEVDAAVGPGGFEILSQNEVEGFARNSSKFTEAVFLRLTKRDADDQLANAKAELAQHLARLAERKRLIEKYYTLSENLQKLETDLKANQKILVSVKHETYASLTEKLSVIAKELEQIAISKQALQRLLSGLEAMLPTSEETADFPANEITAQVLAVYQYLRNTHATLSKPETFAVINGKEKQLLAQRIELKDVLGKFLATQGVSPENLKDISAATTKVAQLEQAVPRAKQQVEQTKAAILEIGVTSDARSKYEAIVRGMLVDLNGQLQVANPQVKAIALSFAFNQDAYRRAIVVELQSLLKAANEGVVREDHILDALRGVEITPTTSPKEMRDALDSQKTKVAEALKRLLTDAKWTSFFRNQVAVFYHDVPRFQSVAVTYGGKSLEACSFGQRCTAVLVLLIQIGNTPLVVDEPEAHLDSTLISEYLVELIKTKKNHRQLMFATHNANFVVNGDAELVHILGSDAQNRTTVTSTTLENLQHRELLLALEGGKKAFARRERRYEAHSVPPPAL